MTLSPTVTNKKSIKHFSTLESLFNKVHDFRYTYDNFVFTGNSSKGFITCKLHGDFSQAPSKHSTGRGCPVCNKGVLMTTPLFIEKASIIHNNRYDYTESVYVNAKSPLIIYCKEHMTKFQQVPDNHYVGHGGCPVCTVNAQRRSTEYFIEKAQKVHGASYDYSKTVYVYSSDKLTITCKVHGDFLQSAASHTAGHGCNLCKNEATRTRNLDFHNLYRFPTIFYVIMYKGVYKIGVTSRDVYTRYRYEVDSLDDITIVHQITFPTYKEAEDFEQSLKLRYYRYRYRGPSVFKFTGNTEIFTDDIMAMHLVGA